MKNVIFEKIRWFDLPLIYYYLKKGHRVYFFDFNLIARRKRWLRTLLDGGVINRIFPFASYRNNNLALESVEKVYATCFKNSLLINSLVRLYGDADIEMAYKKIIVEQLSNFYSVQLFIKERLPVCPENESIYLIPEHYLTILSMLKRSSAEVVELNGVEIPRTARLFQKGNTLLILLRDFFLFNLTCGAAVAIILYKIILSFFLKINPEEYKYAVAIRNPSFQFRSTKNRTFDFLLDHSRINKSNTCFISLTSIDRGIRLRLQKEGYHYIDARLQRVCMSRKFLLRNRTWRRLFIIFIKFWFKNGFGVLLEKCFVIFPSLIMLADNLLWNIVLENLKLENYITFNDEGIRHIGRNILFRQHLCKTWLYAHSASFGCICTISREKMKEHCHWLWAYLVYDYYVAWNKRMIEYQKLHRQKIGTYANIGCIWSTLILKSNVKNATDFLEGVGNKEKRLLPHAKVISVFDTSFIDGVGSEYPMEYGIRFYNDMKTLLDENGDFFMIVKEKKPSRLYAKKDFFIYTVLHKEFFDLLDYFANHPRALVVGSGADPSEIIKISDVVITYAFSSSTTEALGCRKKAIFYDPTDTLREYYYNEIPGLVAHGYQELEDRVKCLLYRTDNKQYEQYLDTEVLFRVEDYLDGMGLERFRNMLVGN